jgi:hypothetical protein
LLQALENHVRRFFSDHEITVQTWPEGPILTVQPEFRVIRAAPGPRIGLWSYTSIGGATLQEGALEFCIHAEHADDRFVELLAMCVHYHRSEALGFGHTFPVGEPWVDGSTCDHTLVSHPYPLGPEFEICDLDEGHAYIAWLLPITAAEREFKISHGLEALESRFESEKIPYWNLQRPSVV